MHKFLLLAFLLAAGSALQAQAMPDPVKKVMGKYACNSCHALDIRLVGPSWKDLARKAYSPKKMGQLIRKPKPENWPDYPPMAPITNISDSDIKVVADWLSKLN